ESGDVLTSFMEAGKQIPPEKKFFKLYAHLPEGHNILKEKEGDKIHKGIHTRMEWTIERLKELESKN
ncbi:MAG: hypothetical protein PVH61_18655, partial [Candidatus Aminicenantes bacterium]